MVLDKRTTPVDAVGYIIAQIIGAIGAAAVVVYVTVSQAAVAAGITKPGAGISDIAALVLETVFTAIFLIVILTVSKRAGEFAGLAIAAHARRDPFRHRERDGILGEPGALDRFGPRRRRLDRLWIYLVGPTIGGIVGWVIFRAMEMTGDEPEA